MRKEWNILCLEISGGAAAAQFLRTGYPNRKRGFFTRMLVFWKGRWHDVALPTYIDPSWGTMKQQRLALEILKGSSVNAALARVEAALAAAATAGL